MSSLFAQYLSERTNDNILETDSGFATYRYLDEKTVYIMDIYIKPDFRKMGVASMLANQICAKAKERGCKELLGTVNPSTKNAHQSMLVLIAYGMTLHSSKEDIVIFRKEL